MSAVTSMKMPKRATQVESQAFSGKSLYIVAGVAALVALAANVLDVILGVGETDIFVYGTMQATDWFALFQENWFKGLYVLGVLNIVYMTAMVPVYFGLYQAHRRTHEVYAALALTVFAIGMAIYVANNAAIPMYVLAGKYAAAGTDAERALFAAAGETVLARGEDFTPGSFLGLVFGGIAAITISLVMLRGGVFGKVTAGVGIAGFTFLSIFTILATFVPALYFVAYYFFALVGGVLALAWFALVALKFLKLGRTG